MRMITVCAVCGSANIDCTSEKYLHEDRCFCRECNKEQNTRDKFLESPYERTRNAVYATGNKWAIENFNATR